MIDLSRRSLMALMGAVTTNSILSPVAFAQGVEGRKFIFVILRGAMDGLAALIPNDDRLAGLRPQILPAKSDRLAIHSDFALHPALTDLETLYRLGEAAFVHAAATPYRSRSHFDGQDHLETLAGPDANGGWLNRAVEAAGGNGLAVGYSVPMALQGPAPVSNWSPPVFDTASDDLLARLSDLYASDPLFADHLATAQMTAVRAEDMSAMTGRGGPDQQYVASLNALGALMTAEGGPGIGMVSFDGWDTHANQAGQFATRLGALGQAVTSLKSTLGSKWAETCVVMCSEFGRTVAENGTRGTDHGTGGLAILAGGAIAGGKIHGDWPGLAASQLHEGRDLAPANDIGAILKGALRDHLGIDRSRLDQTVLPGALRAFDGLIRT